MYVTSLQLTDLGLLLTGLQCIMITGDNPLTAVHVARDVEIVDRDALILDLREGATSETGESLNTLIPFVALTKCS